MEIRYPEYAKKMINRIEDAGYEAYIVGGAVRDGLLGREVNDYDLTTSALPEETAEIFSDFHVITTGLKHGTVTVVIDKMPIEITTYRIDGGYTDSRHPEDVTFTRSIEADLSRRDFTVNAMAFNEKSGLVDLFGGRYDLDARLIRAVGDPERRFTEDALRIMRAFRFASKLGFDIEEKTLAAAEKCRQGLLNISLERRTAELEGILLGEHVKKTLLLMKSAKIFEIVAPDINLDISRINAIDTLPCDFVSRMAFCLIGEEKADKFVSSLRLSNSVSSSVKKIISLAGESFDADTDSKLRRLMSRSGEEIWRLLDLKKALGEDVGDAYDRTVRIIARGDCLKLSDLAVNGTDLSGIGIRGKEIGKTLDFLLENVLDFPELNQKEKLIAIAQNRKSIMNVEN